MLPNSFPAQNTHRLVMFHPDLPPRDDFDRLEELTANGLRAARNALQTLKALPHQRDRSLTADLVELTRSLEMRRLLNDCFIDAASGVLCHLSQGSFQEATPEQIERATHDLKEAVDLSNRVRDLLAAEHDVGWHRGIRD